MGVLFIVLFIEIIYRNFLIYLFRNSYIYIVGFKRGESCNFFFFLCFEVVGENCFEII